MLQAGAHVYLDPIKYGSGAHHQSIDVIGLAIVP
jgi:hypothetical protein